MLTIGASGLVALVPALLAARIALVPALLAALIPLVTLVALVGSRAVVLGLGIGLYWAGAGPAKPIEVARNRPSATKVRAIKPSLLMLPLAARHGSAWLST